jgi:outer membrane protein TolC
MRLRIPTLLLALALFTAASVSGQTAQDSVPAPLTLAGAMQYALDHYPTVRAAVEQVNASAAGVDVAHSAYLPRLDSLWQSNRATANNVFGQLLPQSVIPALTGPVLASASGRSVWGSAAGALVSWEPADFGLRHAGVSAAEAGLARARAGETLTRLEVANAVATAYLNVVAAQRAVLAVQSDLDRRDVLRRAVQTLVDNQLRPGAEASRADAERAAARTRLLQAQANVAVAQAVLARLLGLTTPTAAIASETLLARSPQGDVAPRAAAAHPLAQARQADVDVARANETILSRADYPRLYLQSSVFARGSGANANGVFDGGVGGLGLDRANWAAGVQIVFPNVFDFSTLHARKAAAAATTRSRTALYEEVLLTVTGEQQAAAAVLQAVRAVADNTPVQLAAARQSESQARARYQAGLANIIEVADAQSLLAQAEAQDELARVDVWRALLASAVASGDLTPFLARVRQP